MKKSLYFFVLISFVLNQISVFSSPNNKKIKRNVSDYVKLETQNHENIALMIHKDDLEQDLREKNVSFNLLLDARELFKGSQYPNSIKLAIYDSSVSPKRLLSVLRPTAIKKRQARKFFINFDLNNLQKSSDLEIRLFDVNDNLHGTYRVSVVIDNPNAVTYLDMENSNCGEEFGQCHVDYIIDNLLLKSIPNTGLETQVEKNINGSYTVIIPSSRANKKIKVKNLIDGSSPSPGQNPNLDFEFDGSNLYVVQDGESILVSSRGEQGPEGEPGSSGPAGQQGPPGPLKMDTILLLPADANLPSSNPAIPDLGSNTHRILFDDTTDESVNWSNIKITHYNNQALTARIGYSMNSAVVGDIVFNLELWCTSDGDTTDVDLESYDAINFSTPITVPATAGILDEFAINLTHTDSLTDNDLCAFRLTRDADHVADTAVGDAEVRYLEITE